MNVLFGKSVVNVKPVETFPGRVRCGDFLVFEGTMHKVKTVQPACPYLENLAHSFTHYVTENADGSTQMIRLDTRRVNVLRRIR